MRRALLLLALATPSLAHGGELTAEADLGATFFLGGAGDAAAPGPAFGARVGFAPFSWLTLAAYAGASTHEATVPPPPDGELFQVYQLGLDVRLAARIGRIGLFAEGGGGIGFFSTNVLDDVGITESGRHFGSYVQGGGGVEYHTANPRYAFGLGGDLVVFPDFDFTRSVSVRVYLRYTR